MKKSYIANSFRYTVIALFILLMSFQQNVAQDITNKLGSNGTFKVKDNSEADILTVTDAGNATLKGNLTVANGSDPYTLPTGDGTNGQVMVTDGSGAVSWQTKKHAIGDSYLGGTVFWVDDTGEHGLIAAPTSLDGGTWFSNNYFTGAQGYGVGSGAINTAIIIAVHSGAGAQTYDFAANRCANYTVTVNGVPYGGWYLGSDYEMQLLYDQRAAVGITSTGLYWSSTDFSASSAYVTDFSNGNSGVTNLKNDWGPAVHPIKAF